MLLNTQWVKSFMVIPVIFLAGCDLKSTMVDQFRSQKDPETECQEMHQKAQFPTGENEHYVKPNGDVYSSNPVIGCYYQGTLDKEVERDAEGYGGQGGKAVFLLKLEGGYLIGYVRPVGVSTITREIMSQKQIKKIIRE